MSLNDKFWELADKADRAAAEDNYDLFSKLVQEMREIRKQLYPHEKGITVLPETEADKAFTGLT